jgi:hypothetical protein
MHAVPQLSCFTQNSQQYNIRGIVRYSSTSTADPTSNSWTITDQCADESSSNLVPVVVENVGDEDVETSLELSLLPAIGGSQLLAFQWTVNTQHYSPNTSEPTILLIKDNQAVSSPSDYSVQEITGANKWVYFIIQSLLPRKSFFDHP